jgi:hypothetical protein
LQGSRRPALSTLVTKPSALAKRDVPYPLNFFLAGLGTQF